MQNKVLMTAIAIILITTGSSCSDIVYVSEPLPLPERPFLPAVNNEELSCLDKDVFARVEERDRERRQYCEKLETTILNTHKSK